MCQGGDAPSTRQTKRFILLVNLSPTTRPCRRLRLREMLETPGPHLVASRNVSKKMSDSGGRGWRLPAPEIESAVASVSITSRHASLLRANRLMRMFGGQVFRRDLPQNLLADADARCFATATTNAGTGGYGVMACVRVTSLSPLEKDSIRDWCPLARRDYQRRDAVAPICTNFGRITRSKLLNHIESTASDVLHRIWRRRPAGKSSARQLTGRRRTPRPGNCDES